MMPHHTGSLECGDSVNRFHSEIDLKSIELHHSDSYINNPIITIFFPDEIVVGIRTVSLV